VDRRLGWNLLFPTRRSRHVERVLLRLLLRLRLLVVVVVAVVGLAVLRQHRY